MSGLGPIRECLLDSLGTQRAHLRASEVRSQDVERLLVAAHRRTLDVLVREDLGLPLIEERAEQEISVGDRAPVIDRLEQLTKGTLRHGLGGRECAPLSSIDSHLGDPPLGQLSRLPRFLNPVDRSFAVSSLRTHGPQVAW